MNKLEELENIFADSHICEIQAKFNKIKCSPVKCDNCPLGIGDGVCLKNTFELKWKLQKEIPSLKKENQELRKEYERLDRDQHSIYLDYCELRAKNQKIEKVIEILKKYLFLADEKSLVWNKGYEHSTEVSDEDFENLKEVFGNEIL